MGDEAAASPCRRRPELPDIRGERNAGRAANAGGGADQHHLARLKLARRVQGDGAAGGVVAEGLGVAAGQIAMNDKGAAGDTAGVEVAVEGGGDGGGRGDVEAVADRAGSSHAQIGGNLGYKGVTVGLVSLIRIFGRKIGRKSIPGQVGIAAAIHSDIQTNIFIRAS